MDNKTLHHWEVLAISCIDGRFIKRIVEWVSGKTGGVFDYRTEVGCSKSIIESEDDRLRLFELIRVSIRLHSIKEIWLIDHIDCGAYGGSGDQSEDIEEKLHSEKLSLAGELVRKAFPELKIRSFYANWNEVKEIV